MSNWQVVTGSTLVYLRPACRRPRGEDRFQRRTRSLQTTHDTAHLHRPPRGPPPLIWFCSVGTLSLLLTASKSTEEGLVLAGATPHPSGRRPPGEADALPGTCTTGTLTACGHRGSRPGGPEQREACACVPGNAGRGAGPVCSSVWARASLPVPPAALPRDRPGESWSPNPRTMALGSHSQDHFLDPAPWSRLKSVRARKTTPRTAPGGGLGSHAKAESSSGFTGQRLPQTTVQNCFPAA